MKKKYLILFSLILLFISGYAQDEMIPDVSNPPRLVNDFGGFLSSQEEAVLEQKFLGYEDSTSTQITLVTVETLGGFAIEEFSVKLAEKWKIGQKGKDNGILILLAKQERKSRIEVGYGLEGVIPDMIANRITDEVMRPYFKEGRFYEGIDKGTDIIIKRAFGEFKNDGKKNGKEFPTWLIILIILVIMFIFSRIRGGSSGTYSSGGYYGGGGFFSSSGGSSGSSFGGFGGGSFGGGGASGDW